MLSRRSSSLTLALLASSICPTLVEGFVEGFDRALFQKIPTLQRTAPTSVEGVDIELPDFDELFGRIQKVSPLAQAVIQGKILNGQRGFAAADDKSSELKWKTVESNRNRLVHQIDKIDNFQGKPAPIVRFRSTLKGPCIGGYFGKFVTNIDERKKWDDQIAQVYPLYPVDLDATNIAMGFGRKYGTCSDIGIGYCQTKPALGIGGQEQLTLCGVQDFYDGSCIVWGTEMEEWHNHLLPSGRRLTRAKSHLFSTTLTPTSENTFDVEYVLQLEIGGGIPNWLSTPIMIETVKKLFRHAEAKFAGKIGGLNEFLEETAQRENFAELQSLLIPC